MIRSADSSDDDDEDEDAEPTSTGRAYLELLRLPNVFTAVADVLMGYLVTNRSLDPKPVSLTLAAASACLYLSGMVLNDVFDYADDLRDRPRRPLPSGRISLASARFLGWSLLLAGVILGGVASWLAQSWMSTAVAAGLAIAVLLYDRWLKRTPLGPLSMGACRMLNVLLGMSAGVAWHAPHWLIAGGIGVYVAGITLFARTEAQESRRGQLALGAVVIAAGMLMIAMFPSMITEDMPFSLLEIDADRWQLMWVILGLLIVGRCATAIYEPSPERVQMAVKNCILSIIMLDAVITWAVCGMGWSVIVLALMLPAMFLGRWIYST